MDRKSRWWTKIARKLRSFKWNRWDDSRGRSEGSFKKTSERVPTPVPAEFLTSKVIAPADAESSPSQSSSSSSRLQRKSQMCSPSGHSVASNPCSILPERISTASDKDDIRPEEDSKLINPGLVPPSLL